MLGMALFGAGRIGQMHADNIGRHPGARLLHVYDVQRPAAESAAARHGAKVASSVESVLDDADVAAVLIASATNTHVDLITACVKARKAVLCEKPIDLDIKRVEACWREIRHLEPKVMLGFNRRFDPSMRAVHDALRAGEIGELRQVLITSRDPDIPSVDYMKVAGGLLRDMTIHDFDLARFMLGEEPVEVAALADALIDPVVRELGEHDTAMVIMRTATGKQACITNYRRAVYGYDQRVELVGEKGMLKAENRRATTIERWTQAHTAAQEPLLHFFMERYREAYAAQLDDFVAAVSDGRALPVGFEDGRRALLLADAAYTSLRERRVVSLAI